MRLKIIKPLLFTLLFVLVHGVYTVSAQTDSCIIILKDANSLYEQGDIDASIQLLKSALVNCSLSKEDKIQAHKLLILDFLSIDNLEEANKSVVAIMKLNPNYRPDKFKDDVRLSALFNKYRPQPVFSISIQTGLNLPSITQVKPYSIVYNNDAQNLGKYTPTWLYQFGANANFKLAKRTWLDVAFLYRKTSYTHTLYNIMGNDVAYSEDLRYSELPIGIKYYFNERTLAPYVMTGVNFGILTNALSTTTRDDQTDIADRTVLRNRVLSGGILGFGFSYRIRAFQLYLQASKHFFYRTVNKKSARYADPVNLYKYYYLDDDFKMNHIQINLGASYFLKYRNQKN